MKDGGVVSEYVSPTSDTPTPLVVRHVPVPLTCGVFDGTIITDPSLLEEGLLTTHATVVSTAEGQVRAGVNSLCCVHKILRLVLPGGKYGGPSCQFVFHDLAHVCRPNYAAFSASMLGYFLMDPCYSMCFASGTYSFEGAEICIPTPPWRLDPLKVLN